jgi:iron complex transport system ATP-binding protein
MTFTANALSVRYRAGVRRALSEVTMSVPRGSLYAVLGPNGSGKSTLMKALLGTVQIEEGVAAVEGRAVDEWPRRELARHVGAVSQAESTAFPLSVRQLVEMGRYPYLGPLRPMGPEDRAAVESALERCDVSGLAHRQVGTLSGGEFQRVRIARALAQEPSALILDEPTASLDIRHEMGILRLLKRSAREGVTVVLITHHLNLAARFADLLLLLDEGRVVAEGPVDQVFRSEILESVYRWPLSVTLDPITGSPLLIPLDQD